MFDRVLSELSGKYGLGPKAPQFLTMLLQYMFDPARGGLSGFLEGFKSKGLSSLATSWLGGGNPANEVFPSQIESVMGGNQIADMAQKLGVEKTVVSKAIAGVLPSLVQDLTPNGQIPTQIPQSVGDFVMRSTTSARQAAADAGGGILPWVLMGAILLTLAYFWLQPSADAVKKSEPAKTPPSDTKPVKSEPPPAEVKPAETKTVDTKSAPLTDTKPADPPIQLKPAPEAKPAETKPADTKPAETNPAEAKPAESKPAETKPAEKKD